MDPKPSSPKRQPSNSFIKYGGIAAQMAITIGLAVWLGRYLDEKQNPPGILWTLSLSVLGVAIAMYQSIKDLLR